MVQISKSPLSKSDEMVLFIQLTQLFSKKSDIEVQGILSNLLGYEEKLMLAKRFAIVVLLWKKQSIYSIAKIVHVSTSTVARIHQNYHAGAYINIIEALDTRNPSIVAILKSIDDVLHLGGILPHYGQTHRSEMYKRDMEAKKKRGKIN